MARWGVDVGFWFGYFAKFIVGGCFFDALSWQVGVLAAELLSSCCRCCGVLLRGMVFVAILAILVSLVSLVSGALLHAGWFPLGLGNREG